jgi:hypothetical protein
MQHKFTPSKRGLRVLSVRLGSRMCTEFADLFADANIVTRTNLQDHISRRPHYFGLKMTLTACLKFWRPACRLYGVLYSACVSLTVTKGERTKHSPSGAFGVQTRPPTESTVSPGLHTIFGRDSRVEGGKICGTGIGNAIVTAFHEGLRSGVGYNNHGLWIIRAACT